MARVTKPLTDTQVKQAGPKDKEYSLWDGQGLHLRIKPSGSKAWLLSFYRPHTGKRALLSLGLYPTVTLSKARVLRQNALKLLSQDIDPSEHRKEEKTRNRVAHGNTFRHVADQWLKLKESKVSDSYFQKINNRLDKYIFPKIGRTPIHKINAVEVIGVISPLADEDKLETVKKLCRWVNEIMVHAVNTGLVYSNPLSGIGKAFNAPKVVNLPTLKPDELPELMGRLNIASIKIVTRCLIEWQLHTMTRPGEAAGARWDEINLKKVQWEIPAERMKKNRPHVVPLSSQALAILEVVRPFSGHREFIFPSDKNPRTSANSQTANRALNRMGFKGRLVSHGLRALASTTLNEQGFDPDVIEAALAHVDKNAIRAAYNRAEYIEQRRKMMQWWSDHIEKAAAGSLSITGTKHLRMVTA